MDQLLLEALFTYQEPHQNLTFAKGLAGTDERANSDITIII